MNQASLRFQMQQIDLALLALFQERARLFKKSEGLLEDVALEDLLRRADGSVSADVIRAVFQQLNQVSTS
ncbi:MAG: hypothetical protein QM477_01940 [Planctomycetota bacterium]